MWYVFRTQTHRQARAELNGLAVFAAAVPPVKPLGFPLRHLLILKAFAREMSVRARRVLLLNLLGRKVWASLAGLAS
jgi:hypothetical protein